MPTRKSTSPADDAPPRPYLERWLIEQLMFGSGRVRRFTQDSPVLPDVWLEFAIDPKTTPEHLTRRSRDQETDPHPAVSLLLTPYRAKSAGTVSAQVRKRIEETRKTAPWKALGHDPASPMRIIYNQSTVGATLYFEDLIRGVIPLTDWWQSLGRKKDTNLDTLGEEQVQRQLARAIVNPEHQKRGQGFPKLPADVLWMMRIVGALARVHRGLPLPAVFMDEKRGPAKATEDDWYVLVHEVATLMEGIREADATCLVHSVALNRVATPTISKSRNAVKADAVERVFGISCADIRWAIIDSGIDATHRAFRKREKIRPDAPKKEEPVNARFEGYESRVKATYDFSQVQKLLDPDVLADEKEVKRLVKGRGVTGKELKESIANLRNALSVGSSIDWGLVAPLLEIPHDKTYENHIPNYDHGTHVAGILAGRFERHDPDEDDVIGICPDIELYDFRILNEDGQGDEFTVMAALQFVRWLNSTNDYMAVHGVNMSLSIPHDVANYACGRTPVCEEAERVVSSGVVVVAAAGNQGYRKYTDREGVTNETYNTISITDPGNAELVITVGATHRARPHTYGVSYFSSRGPTGDGRSKPDLVAPGEKITSVLPDDSVGVKDGTSMAAPHVSGAAALLMARYDELVGRPARIKEILRDSATDLGRERYFQGAGMLDILRALQSV
jgi:serine protease AprX